MFNCSNCHKSLDDDTNFCPRCGFKQEINNKCPICLDNKELSTLLCGHNICKLCINTSYRQKPECPICRENIEKCPECYQFRVVKLQNGHKKCLDCKSKISNVPSIINNEKIKCIDCNSSRVLFNPDDNRYNCMDCFAYFSNQTTHVVPIPKTKICMICFSNLIEFLDYPIMEDEYDRYVIKNRCKNCLKENVETKTISLEDYSKIIVKSKEEVNPTILKICPKCDSKDIYCLENHVNQTFNCNGCDNKCFIPKFVRI